jgi:hypothetical protein
MKIIILFLAKIMHVDIYTYNFWMISNMMWQKFDVLLFVWKTEENHEGISMNDLWVEI